MSLKPESKTTIWRHKTAWERVDMCRGMLLVHGFISDSENKRIKARIAKWASPAPTRSGA